MAEEQANTSPEMAARLEYLGSLDYQRFDLEEELENKINLLETEYKAKYAVLDKELRDIVSGKLDVVDGQTVEPTSQEGERGIPGFWAKALQTNPDIQEMITERDQEVLQYLTCISTQDVNRDDLPEELQEDEDQDFETLSVVFHFAENPFFTNDKLVKSFIAEDHDSGITVVHDNGTPIDWKSPSKNVTVKVMKKKGKPGGGKKGQAAQIKVVPVDSFFNFFSSSAGDSDAGEDDDEAVREERQADLERMRELIDLCEHPLDWYTGQALKDRDSDSGDDFSDEDEGDYSDEDEDDSEDDDDSDDDDEGPRRQAGGKPATKGGPKGGARGAGKPGPAADAQGNPQDCKQQ